MISDEDKERVRAATDIVQLVSETVVLRQRGGDFWGCCPFHQEKSPSFHVNPSTGLWHCFGCHAGGDVFDYVMRRESLEFLDSVRFLADRAHIELAEDRTAARRGPRRSRLLDVMAAAEEVFHRTLMRGKGQGPDDGRAYLSGRGFGSAVCSRWQLGFAEGSGVLLRELTSRGFTRQEILAADLALDRGGRLRERFFGRVMFPIHDEQGHCIAFGGRVMDSSKPKYLNTKETPIFHKSRHMYAFDVAKETIASTGYAIVNEGYTDVIAMHEAGFTNAVATLGTALSLDHVKLLSRFAKTIVCMFDGDAAGLHAAEAAVRYMEATKASMRCVVLPDDLDPAEFLEAHGADAMRAQLAGAQDLLDFVFDRRLATYDLSSPGLRLAALDSMATLLAPLKRSYLLDGYVTQLASRLGVEPEACRRKVMEAKVEAPPQSPQVAEGSYERPSEPVQAPYQPPARSRLDALSPEDRTQIRAERNLLSMLADKPDLFRPYADRIATFTWADARHEAIAWAILATPVGTSAADAVLAAVRACPDAPKILAAGGFAATSSWDDEKNVGFVVTEAEVRSIDREAAELRRRIDGTPPGSEARAMLQRLSELRTRRAELRRGQPQE